MVVLAVVYLGHLKYCNVMQCNRVCLPSYRELTAPNDVVDASLHVRLNLRPDSVLSIHGQLAGVGWSPSPATLTDGGRGNIAR